MMATNAGLYEQVVHITRVYLGPAADRFIDRQIEHHLQKMPREISTDDLKLLIDWIRVAVSLLTNERDIIEEYLQQLDKLVVKTKHAQGGNPK